MILFIDMSGISTRIKLKAPIDDINGKLYFYKM